MQDCLRCTFNLQIPAHSHEFVQNPLVDEFQGLKVALENRVQELCDLLNRLQFELVSAKYHYIHGGLYQLIKYHILLQKLFLGQFLELDVAVHLDELAQIVDDLLRQHGLQLLCLNKLGPGQKTSQVLNVLNYHLRVDNIFGVKYVADQRREECFSVGM